MTEILATFWNLVPVTLVQSLAYSLIAIGIMIPFRMLALPDLTCEGSFPLGGCLAAALVTASLDPFVATALAVAAGFAAGCATAWIHLKLRIHSLLAGILVFTMIWSANLRVLGKPNVALPPGRNVFDAVLPQILLSNAAQVAAFAGVVALGFLLLAWLFRTEVGLSMRCVGANARLSPAVGIHARLHVIAGFGLANAFSAAGGALVVQQQGYADVTMGFGVLINGLASLIIGEALIGRRTVVLQVAAPIVGSIVYYQLVSLGLATGLNPSDLKFLTGAFVLLTLAIPLMSGRRARLSAPD